MKNIFFIRLKDQCAEYEAENIEVKENLAQLNEDRADVIAYLKRILKSKTDEIFELRERVVALQQVWIRFIVFTYVLIDEEDIGKRSFCFRQDKLKMLNSQRNFVAKKPNLNLFEIS